ncbi:unnamed protein product [Cochlearia groenlandica]
MYSFLFLSLLTLSLLSFFFAIFFLLLKSHRRRASSVYKQKLLSESEDCLTKSRLYEFLKEDSEAEEDQGVSAKTKKTKKKKNKGKKKKSEIKVEEIGENPISEGHVFDSNRISNKPEIICLYPFTSTTSATQRKIKQQYDHLVKCNSVKGLTLSQVGEFANCLIEAKNELQHKSEVIKRKFSITKALLFKADRSSFDRLRQQIYKLETEQKRVEEDALVYNWLQQQLKLSPAYKKVLEISASMELKNKSNTELDSPNDDETSDISFEELLEKEKKDSFWHKNGRLRTCRT